jgi:hypothetical protein
MGEKSIPGIKQELSMESSRQCDSSQGIYAWGPLKFKNKGSRWVHSAQNTLYTGTLNTVIEFLKNYNAIGSACLGT